MNRHKQYYLAVPKWGDITESKGEIRGGGI